MKKYEKVALALMALGCTLLLLMTTSSDPGNLPTDLLWPGAALTFALLISSIVVIKMGSERETGEKKWCSFSNCKKRRKKMTYREIMQRLHPEWCGPSYVGGCCGCPGYILNGAPTQYGDLCENAECLDPAVCRRCWDAELAPLKEKA